MAGNELEHKNMETVETETKDKIRSAFTPASQIIDTSIQAIEKLGPIYKNVKMAGFLTIAGVTIAILTIGLSFLTGTGEESKWYGGITIWEEILFMIVAILFVSFGVIFLLKNNAIKSSIQKTTIDLGSEKNRWIHEETMAKFGIRGSAESSQSKEKQQEIQNGANPVIKDC